MTFSLLPPIGGLGPRANITKSTDSVQVAYDGGGAAGYSGSVAISAAGAATQNVSVSPLYVTPSAYVNGTGVSFPARLDTSSLAIAEAGAPGTLTYTATPSGCSGIASFGSLSGSGSSASIAATAGTIVSTCTTTIADSTGTSIAVPIAKTTFVPTAIPNGTLWLAPTIQPRSRNRAISSANETTKAVRVTTSCKLRARHSRLTLRPLSTGFPHWRSTAPQTFCQMRVRTVKPQ